MKLRWLLLTILSGAAVVVAFRFGAFRPPNQTSDGDRAVGATTAQPPRPVSDVAAPDTRKAQRLVNGTTGNAVESSPAAYDRDALDRLFAEALDNVNSGERRLLLQGVAEFLAKNDPAKARDYLKRILARGGNTADSNAYVFVQVFADNFGYRSPRAAVDWAEAIPDRWKEVAYQSVTRHWAASDPKALAAWTSTLADPALRSIAIRTLSHQLLQAGAAGFGPEWAAGLSRTEDGPRFSDLIVQHWARTDPLPAMEWVASLGNTEDAERALVALTTTVAEANPAKALEWVERLPAGEVQNQAVQATVSAWATKEPAAAAAWVDAHSTMPGLLQNSAHTIATSWMRTDRVAATRWLERAALPRELKDYVLTTTATPGGRP